jgi:phosphoglycolate phosphatase
LEETLARSDLPEGTSGQQNPSTGVKCVVYDCDGVLFDSLEANRTLYDHIAVSNGRGPLTENELRYCHINTVKDSIHRLFDDDPEGEAHALQFLSEQIDFKDYVPYLKMEPHVMETLTGLRGNGMLTAINTNRTTSMPHLMQRFDLFPYFDMVVTALDVVRPKPDPESMHRILHTLNVKPHETLYVGDSVIDLETAESSQVRFVAYKNPSISRGISIDDHRKILEYIDKAQMNK